MARFHREVEAAAQLEHPNIVTAYDAFEAGGQHYLVMQFVDGQDLSSVVKTNGPLTVEQALEVIIQAAKGLEFAHEQGIIHRDIKPSNLLLRKKDGRVKILDMGLARLQAAGDDDVPELTASGQIMGTYDYMPPEQAWDTRTVDARADIYALGCTLYRLLAGKPMYQGETPMQKLLAHREKPIPSVRDARPDVPQQLDAIYQQMVAKQPDDRQASMTVVVQQLQGCMQPAASSTSVSEFSDSALTFFVQRLKEEKQTTAGQSNTFQQSRPEVDTTQPRVPATPTPSEITPLGVKEKRRTKEERTSLLFAIGSGVLALFVLMGAASGVMWWLGQRTDNSDSNKAVPPPAAKRQPKAVDDGPNYALRFDGTGHVKVPGGLGRAKTTSATIEAVVLPALKSKNNPILNVGNKHLKTQGGQYQAHQHSGGTQANASSKVSPTKQGVHLAGVFDGVSVTLFVDGRMADTQTVTEQYRLTFMEVEIGANLSQSHFFDGVIDEVRISSTARYTEDFTPPTRHEPDEHTLALYHFDEGQGSTLTDHSGNGHHGKIHNATWVHADGSPLETPSQDWTLDFEDQSSWVQFPNRIDAYTREATYEFYVWFRRANSFRDEQILSGKHTPSFRRKKDGRLQVTVPVFHAEQGDSESIQMFCHVPAQQRLHCAMVFNCGRMVMFIDGKFVGSQETTATLTSTNLRQLSHHTSEWPLALAGRLDEIRVSNIARYQEDFTPAKRFEPDKHTLALYHFDEANFSGGNGTIVYDASGNGHHGTIHGNVKWVPVDWRDVVQVDSASSWGKLLPANAPPPAIAPFMADEAKEHQQAWADYLDIPLEKEVELPGSPKLELVLIPPGEFLMGMTEEEQAHFLRRKPIRELSSGFPMEVRSIAC